jgi:HK97 gp10 family phage protein
MINIKITVEGQDEVKSFVKAFEKEKAEAVKKVVKDTTRSTAKEIRGVTPVGKTGILKKNIKSQIKNDYYGKVYVPYGSGKANHFHLVEFGTKFANAADFFFQVYNRKMDQFGKDIQRIFK